MIISRGINERVKDFLLSWGEIGLRFSASLTLNMCENIQVCLSFRNKYQWVKWTEKRFLTLLPPPPSQFNLLNLWFLSIVISWRLWNACFTVLLKGFIQEYSNNINFVLERNIPSLLFTNSNWFYYPSSASVFTKYKFRISGSNVSPLTGVFAVIWIICMLSAEVSSSFLVSCLSHLNPTLAKEATEGRLLRLLQRVLWQSEDIYGCFFFNCSEQAILHICWCQITLKKSVWWLHSQLVDMNANRQPFS